MPGRHLLAALAALLLMGCAGGEHTGPSTKVTSPRAAATPAVRRSPASYYVGSAVCITCHHDEGKTWLGSHHQITLRWMNPHALGPLAPPLGTVPDTGGLFRITLTGEKYVVRYQGNPEKSLPLTFAFGSGAAAMTYTSVHGNRVIEFRESYDPVLKRWYPTPERVAIPPGVPGLEHPPDISHECLSCHTTALPATGLIPRTDLFGVGCERCHGPGSQHVAAEYQGETDKGMMPDLSRWNGSQINQLCGSCHRTVKAVNLSDLAAASTNRFQPYGLSLSRCFRESRGRLTCVTCHDPHTDASTDLHRYEQICLTCHTTAAVHASTAPGVVHAHPCPVNPVSGCVGCHMPTRKTILDSPVPVMIADHWIRIFKAHSP